MAKKNVTDVSETSQIKVSDKNEILKNLSEQVNELESHFLKHRLVNPALFIKTIKNFHLIIKTLTEEK